MYTLYIICKSICTSTCTRNYNELIVPLSTSTSISSSSSNCIPPPPPLPLVSIVGLNSPAITLSSRPFIPINNNNNNYYYYYQ